MAWDKRVAFFSRKPFPADGLRGLAAQRCIGLQLRKLFVEGQIKPISKNLLMLLDERLIQLPDRLTGWNQLAELVALGFVLQSGYDNQALELTPQEQYGRAYDGPGGRRGVHWMPSTAAAS